MNYSILVNKDHPIDKTYTVTDLVSIGKHYSSAENRFLETDIETYMK